MAVSQIKPPLALGHIACGEHAHSPAAELENQEEVTAPIILTIGIVRAARPPHMGAVEEGLLRLVGIHVVPFDEVG